MLDTTLFKIIWGAEQNVHMKAMICMIEIIMILTFKEDKDNNNSLNWNIFPFLGGGFKLLNSLVLSSLQCCFIMCQLFFQ